MIRFFLLCSFVCVFALSFTVQAASPQAIETKGILTNAEMGQIAPNVWSGLTRSDALLLLKSLPTQYASPTYYELARRLLLSDAPAFSAAEGAGPDILVARLDKLLEMGALRDAESLYDTVVAGVPDNFELVFRSLEILMLRGQLSAACLDLQAMQAQHAEDPRWKELNRLCRIQFSSASERAQLVASSKFEEYPQLAGFLRGRMPSNVTSLKTQDLAFATALDLVNPASIRTLSPKAGKLPPLLLSVLIMMDTEEAVPEKACLLIESARRGISTTRELITLYEHPHYDAKLLLDNIEGEPALGGIHPCMVPSVMYQRIASNKQPDRRNAAIRVALRVMDDLPDAAFWPMALYFRDFDVRASVNKKYLWRLSRIVAYEKGDLPSEWGQGWAATQKDGRGVQAGVSPFWPVQAVAGSESDSMESFAQWRNQWPSEFKRMSGSDPLIPLLLGQSLAPAAAKTGENPKTNLGDYENILSLTFSRSYAIPSYGLTQRFNSVIEKGQTGQSVSLLLIGYGAIPPDQIIPEQMALVIRGLNKASLERYSKRFALEVLR